MYPPLGCYFRILFSDSFAASNEEEGFQSISGLEANFLSSQEQEILPTYAILVLKRAARSSRESGFSNWLFKCINQKETIALKEAHIELLNEDHEALMRWTIRNITPKSWKLGELHAEKREVLIETIELQYEEVFFETIPSEKQST